MFDLLLAAATAASISTPEAAIAQICEPLIAGASVAQSEAKLVGDGFRQEVLAGQRAFRKGELILSMSDKPRVCFVQAATSVTRAEGFAIVDRWGARRSGAIRSPATNGPDGSPVRAWADPAGNIALVASHQTTATGQKVVAFIVMPAPQAQRRQAQ